MIIRIDDFPHGDKNMHISNPYAYESASKIIDILEAHQVNYLWGVSPLLCENKHFSVLSKVKYGSIIMHGFDHGFGKIENWNKCTECWSDGGEFSFYTQEEIKNKYIECRNILQKFSAFDEKHFIPPFNCYNQALLNVLNEISAVEFIHTCDQEWRNYNQYNLDYGRIKVVMSELYKSYDDLHNILRRFSSLSGIITLHWIYDTQHSNWELNYKLLGERLQK